MLNIKFGTPQLLILLSFFMYTQSFWFSFVMFLIGVIGAGIDFSVQWSEAQEKIKKESKAVEDVNEGLKTIFSLAMDKNNQTSH